MSTAFIPALNCPADGVLLQDEDQSQEVVATDGVSRLGCGRDPRRHRISA